MYNFSKYKPYLRTKVYLKNILETAYNMKFPACRLKRRILYYNLAKYKYAFTISSCEAVLTNTKNFKPHVHEVKRAPLFFNHSKLSQKLNIASHLVLKA